MFLKYMNKQAAAALLYNKRIGRKNRDNFSLMATTEGKRRLHFVFMNYDPEYERLRANKTKRGVYELDSYLSNKHDQILARNLQPGTYKKTNSLVIVDGFSVEINDDQANVLRSAKEVRIVETNQELV